MRVLLVNPRISGEGKPWFPLGIGYIAANLRKHGFVVKVIDNNLYDYNARALARIMKQYQPDIVGIGGMTVQCNDAIKVGKILKSINENINLVYGGVHFTFRPEDGLMYGDIVVLGEGEEAFLKTCEGRDPHKIQGIAFKEGDRLVVNPPKLIRDLDALPLPAYDLFEIDKYEDKFITGERAMSIMTGRGCPFNCIFCASPQLWERRVRYHSLGYVLSHIDFLVEKYHLKNLRIMDDVFPLSIKRVLDFCNMIEEKGFKLSMACLAYAKCADYEMFKRMKEVGFSIISFGIESGNDEVLRLINKGITKDDARNAVHLAKKAGLSTELLFMIGNIGETKQSIIESIEFAKELNPPGSNHTNKAQWNGFQFATPIPGSKFYHVAKQYGKVTTYDFDKYFRDEPIFIPRGLDKKTMIRLMSHAFLKTNVPTTLTERFLQAIPTLLRRYTSINIARKIYKLFKGAKRKMLRKHMKYQKRQISQITSSGENE